MRSRIAKNARLNQGNHIVTNEKIIDVRVEEVQQCPLPFFVDLISQGEDGHRSASNLSSHQHRYQADRAAARAFTAYKLGPARVDCTERLQTPSDRTVKESLTVQPSRDALFDGSNAHLLNDAGDAFESGPDSKEP